MKTISHSGLNAYRGCPRSYEHQYVDLRVSKSAPAAPLAFGRLWDQALTAWHWGTSSVDRLERALAVILPCKNDLMRETQKALIVGYTARYGDSPWRPRSTQVEFATPIRGIAPVECAYIGVIDAILEHAETGEVVILESKTSSEDIEPGSPYWQRVTQLDPQVQGYFDGALAAGFENVERCVYDVTRKPTIRQKQTETPLQFGDRLQADVLARPEFYFVRQDVVRLEREAAEFWNDVRGWVKAIEASNVDGRWPRNPGHCRSFGRACGYVGVCTGVVSLDDPEVFAAKPKR